jgi:hypothetical protein
MLYLLIWYNCAFVIIGDTRERGHRKFGWVVKYKSVTPRGGTGVTS